MIDLEKLTPFQFFALTNFPYIEADFDALTNYQLFCEITKYLNGISSSQNDVISNFNELLQNWNDFSDAITSEWDETKDYIDNYFENLDVQEEINNKLDQMASDGTLLEVIQSTVVGEARTITENWLAQLTPSTEIIIDTTLTVAGACADAKATGDAISEVKGALDGISSLDVKKAEISLNMRSLYYIDIANAIVTHSSTATDLSCSTAIAVEEGEVYEITCSGRNNNGAYALGTNNILSVIEPSVSSSGTHIIMNRIIVIPSGVTQLFVSQDSSNGVPNTAVNKLTRKTINYEDLSPDTQKSLENADSNVSTVSNCLLSSVDKSASLEQSDTYQTISFGDIDAGKYSFVFETDADVSFSQIRFMYGTSTVTTYNSASFAKIGKPFIYNFDCPSSINRIRIYNLSQAVNIRILFLPYAINNSAIKNASKLPGYIGDFVTNKAATATWITGKAIYAENPAAIRDDANYCIMHLDVKCGDYIKLKYNASHLLSRSRSSLAERIIYGSGDNNSWFRVIATGGQEEVVYIAEKDMKMTIGGITLYKPDVYHYSAQAYGQSAEFSARRYQRFDYTDITKKFGITKASYNGYNDLRPKPLSLLHFSDPHDNVQNISAIKQFKELYGGYLNDVICTGDMTTMYFDAYLPIFAQNGYKSILLAIGNHDVYPPYGNDYPGYNPEAHPEDWATGIEKYNQYIAPSVSEWGTIGQPTGASTTGLCYYYKDYSSNGYGYRLIVLDAMAFDDAQYNWLVSVLADAKTNELTVVIAEHFPPITSENDIDGFETPFMSMLSGMESNYSQKNLHTDAGYATDAVDDFIENGGEFACWICGHMHYDQIGTLVSHPNQIFVAVGSANALAIWADQPRYANTPSEDLFNIITIDPYLKLIKIQRIGAVVDDWGRMHDHVSINYETKTVISTSK